MNTAVWIAVLALPFVGALHRFAATYGYRGRSARESFADAVDVALVLTLFSLFYSIARLGEHW